MSLEKITSQDNVLTKEIVRQLAAKYANELERIRKENQTILERVDLILDPKTRKKILAKLGQISLKVNGIDEELRASLN